MARRRITRIGALVAGFLVVGLVGFGVGGFAGGGMAHGFGGPGMHMLMSRLVDDLDLNEDQQQRLDAVHEALGGHHEAHSGTREQHHEWLVEQIRSGNVDSVEVRQSIDLHLEAARSLAYQVSDELVPLLNSLDETQRETLLDFIDEVHGSMEGHGCGGPHGLMKHGHGPR
jgi:hypothetical protein